MPFLRGTRFPLMGEAPFVPSDLENLELWTRYNQGIAITGAGVSQWNDQSGNGNHLKQGTDTNRPSKEAEGSILFDGVDNYLKADAFTLNQPETIYILGKQVTWTSSDILFDGEGFNSGRLQQITSTPQLRPTAGTQDAGLNNGDLALDTYGIIAVVFNGASSSLQINNGTEATGDAGSNNMGGFTLGVRGAAGDGWSNIQVKEVIIYSTAHDAETRTKVIAYLAHVGSLSI